MLLDQLDSDSDARSQTSDGRLSASPVKRPPSCSNDMYSSMMADLDSDTDAESQRSSNSFTEDMPSFDNPLAESTASPLKRLVADQKIRHNVL